MYPSRSSHGTREICPPAQQQQGYSPCPSVHLWCASVSPTSQTTLLSPFKHRTASSTSRLSTSGRRAKVEGPTAGGMSLVSAMPWSLTVWWVWWTTTVRTTSAKFLTIVTWRGWGLDTRIKMLEFGWITVCCDFLFLHECAIITYWDV